MVATAIKVAQFDLSRFCLKEDGAEATQSLNQLEGVMDAKILEAGVTSYISVTYRQGTTNARDILREIRKLGYSEAKYVPKKDKDDIREILGAEVDKFRRKFLFCLAALSPVLILMWVVPYSVPSFLVENQIINGVPIYILLLLVFSSIIQFALGKDFYSGAYKSVSNGSANMDVLVVLGTTAAWFYGLVLIMIGYDEMDHSGMDHE